MPFISRRLSQRSVLPVSLAIGAIVLAMIAAACGGNDHGFIAGFAVTGQITEVIPRSLTEFESITVVDSDGKVWEFTGGRFAGFTPSHLLEHMALGETVKVSFVEDGGNLTVVSIEDG